MAVLSRPVSENASLTNQIYRTLRQDILRGTLPPGKTADR